jgi:hypothetical protein
MDLDGISSDILGKKASSELNKEVLDGTWLG